MKAFLYCSMLVVLACASSKPLTLVGDTAAITAGSMDKVLGWVYGPEFDACSLKLPTVLQNFQDLMTSMTTLDVDKIDSSWTTFYEHYAQFPQCSFAVNIPTVAVFTYISSVLL